MIAGDKYLRDTWRHYHVGMLAIAPIMRLCQYVDEGRRPGICLNLVLMASVVASVNALLRMDFSSSFLTLFNRNFMRKLL